MSQRNSAQQDPAGVIESGQAVLGMEFGSTRIKATLVGPDFKPIASGSHGWENKLENGVWTYHMDDVWNGMVACYADLKNDVKERYGVTLRSLAAAGFSGMMHGYIPTDDSGELLVPFRTWRNNITEVAASKLTDRFQFAIPQRWSIAHLYQAMLNGESHLPKVSHITTLAGYVHWRLTGEWALGTCEASGMFPVDPDTGDYDARMLGDFDSIAAEHEMPWKIRDLLPRVVGVGEPAGSLTEEGARLLDPDGDLEAGIPLAPPEGDAGTGMVATNSVRARTGNASAGTSAFAMVVLEKKLKHYHQEINVVLTPDGKQVAMAHSNNCTTDFDAWMGLFAEAAQKLGTDVPTEELYGTLMPLALDGDPDAGGVLTYGYVSGEHMTGFSEGRPLVVRNPDGNFNLSNFVRAHLFSSLAALRMGLDIVTEEEGVAIDQIRGHGGFFKTPEVGQRIMAAATNSTVGVLETAGEGGAWGMALLAAYTAARRTGGDAGDFVSFLDEAHADSKSVTVEPKQQDVDGFNAYLERYKAGIPAERAAVDNLR